MADEDAGRIDDQKSLASVVEEIVQNELEPSTTFMANIHHLYQHPRNVIIEKLQTLKKSFLNVLRDQLFFIFYNQFSEEELIENQFNLTEDMVTKHLKKRVKTKPLSSDIYGLGYSIINNRIQDRLASEILSSTNRPLNGETSSTSNVIDTNSQQILSKLQTLIDSNNKIVQENRDLKDRVTSLENVVSNLTRAIQQLSPRQDVRPKPASYADIFKSPTSTRKTDNIKTNRPADDTPNPSTKPSNTNHTAPSPNLPTDKADKKTPLKPSNPNQNKKPTTIFGDRKATNTRPITGRHRPFSLFVGGLDPNLSTNDIKQHIERDIGLRVIAVTSNRISSYNQSVKLDINAEDKEFALDSSTWYKGMIVKPFKIRRNEYNPFQDMNYTRDQVRYPFQDINHTRDQARSENRYDHW